MKKVTYLCLALVVLLVASNKSTAQKARGGIKGGLNLSTLYLDDVEDENVRAGFHAGFYTQLMLAPSFAIQPELNFSTKGSSADYNFAGFRGESKFNLSYLDVPVLATFKLGDDVDIHIGPYVGYLVGVNTSSEGDFGDSRTELDRDDYEKWDYGISGGMALNFNPMSIGVRYNYGLNEIADSDDAARLNKGAKNAVGQVYVAFDLK
ncbi:porin family protein [Fulvivirga aurantia]|uniref:porin family protein n=1 Tax=Fulvivirga aurantia TaxID=2529383 RepID=UPI0016299480|nr:porin family protein [Fulvivirga aurantia]